MIYQAVLQNIPKTLYAVELDGADGRRQFTHITLPLLKPVTFFVVSVEVIRNFQLFDQSCIFSGGTSDPNNIVLLIYQAVFRNLQMGYATAIAFLLQSVTFIREKG